MELYALLTIIISSVSFIDCLPELVAFVLKCSIRTSREDYRRFHSALICSSQALSLFLLSAYYKFLGGFPLVAVASLLLYVGCYQVKSLSHLAIAFVQEEG